MSTSRYRVIAPNGIFIGTSFYPVNSLIILTTAGAKYLLLSNQIELASQQAPSGSPGGPNEDDVKLDVVIDGVTKQLSLSQLIALFPSIQGPPGPQGPQGPAGPSGGGGGGGGGTPGTTVPTYYILGF